MTIKERVAAHLRKYGSIDEATYRLWGYGKHLSGVILLLVREGWDIRTRADGANGYTLYSSPGGPAMRPTMFGPDDTGRRT